MRSRSRLATALFVAGVTVSFVGSVGTARAAVEWSCQFGPEGETLFDFTSIAGDEDSLEIAGRGECSRGPVNVCGLVGSPRCLIGLPQSRAATISGSAVEGPSGPLLYFGSCDADPPPPNRPDLDRPLKPLVATVKLTIDIVGGPSFTRTAVWPFFDFDVCSVICAPFPSPAPHLGNLLKGGMQNGHLTLFTRIAGNCPTGSPPGNDMANAIDVRFLD